MIGIKIAVLSDLHATGQTEKKASWLCGDTQREPVHGHPVMSLVETIKRESLAADFVFVPGDITDKCDLHGFQVAWEGIRRVAQALGTDQIYATTGNHDVDHKKLHGNRPADPIRTQLGVEYPFTQEQARSHYWSNHFALIDKESMLLLAINSAAKHANEAEAKRGKIDDTMLEQIKEALTSFSRIGERGDQVKIALCHHHPHQHSGVGLADEDLMVYGDKLLRLLERYGFSLLIHGHKHHPSLEYAAGGNNAPTVFAAGSFSGFITSDLATKTRNLFHIVSLESSDTGIIHSWQFHKMIGWEPSTESGADFPAQTGFGFRGNLKDLAGRIDDFLKCSGNQIVYWNKIAENIREVQYLLPTSITSLVAILNSQQIDVFRDVRGQPDAAARLVR